VIYSIRIYNVDPAHVGPFVASVRQGGLYRELAQQLHFGYIGCDLLSSNVASNRFLLLEFWLSEAAFNAAQRRPETKVLASFLGRLATSCEDLGAFGFLPPRNLGFNSVPENCTALVD
jgi:hypothetical protein